MGGRLALGRREKFAKFMRANFGGGELWITWMCARVVKRGVARLLRLIGTVNIYVISISILV